jgi:uncharacterized membrane protein/protein-disulfide isomerase
MARTQAAVATSAPAPSTRWLLISALIGLGFAAASTWVHYRILHDPLYSSICDVNATFSCTEAYTSRFGSVAGVPVALIGVLYFSFVLGLLALCGRSTAARQNAAGYVFALSTLGLAGVLYLGYASFFILQTVCLLCVGAYAAIIALFVISGQAARYPMSTLPGRASRDFRLLLRTPAALTAALAFVGLAAVAIMVFPAEPISASSDVPAPGAIQAAPAQPPVAVPDALLKQLDDYLSKQPRLPIVVGASGASVVIIKFNDYQCPPCGQTFREYKPVLARLQQKYPGKIAFITRDFPLDPECNPRGGTHQAACEAAVAVRLAREKGRADAMEDWLFANQATLTPERVREGAATIGGVSDFATRYPQTLELVRGEISQGLQLKVGGTPTFFMNGLRLGNWPSEVFEAAVEWELRRLAAASR